MRMILVAAATLFLFGTTASDAFEIKFDWAGLKSCTNGDPNSVPSPEFALTDVPEGTKFIKFKLVDKDVPGYNHGGGTVSWSGEGVVSAGAFTYKSPCPPNGSHKYEWTATAQSKKSGGVLGKAKTARMYPE